MHIKVNAASERLGRRGEIQLGRRLSVASFESMPFGSDPWRLIAEGAATRLRHLPALFTLGNGLIGRRGPGDPPCAPAVYLNGVFEKVPIVYHEAAHGYARQSDTRLAVADAPAIVIKIDGENVCAPKRIELDLRRGMTLETIIGPGVEIRIERLVSMERRGVVAARLILRAAEEPCRLEISTSVAKPPQAEVRGDGPYDPRIGPAIDQSPWTEERVVDETECIGRVDRLQFSEFAVAALASIPPTVVELAAGDETVIDCFAAYGVARGQSGDPLLDARPALSSAHQAGFDTLVAEQDAWFDAYWQAAFVALPDSPFAEQALRHGLFQLVQAVGRDGLTSIAAKGQTGEGYEGHVFWDADLYVLPVFACTRPEIARSMLEWRITGLDAARANARAMGQLRGALYPWRTIEGGECSSFFPAGSAQYHLNADIAHALRFYVETSGDPSILADGGAEMLVETARIWLEIGYHDPARGGAFVINRVTGPDEYSAIVDNNLYTNMMAAEHLRYAAIIGVETGSIDPAEAALMAKAANAMLLPFDAERAVYAQDDAFFAKQPWPFGTTPESDYPLLLHYHPLTIYRYQVAKQADAVLAIALLRDKFDPALRRRMLDTYEAVTVHDSTLSASAFATVAAGVRDAERALCYWRISLLTDLGNLFENSEHGLHMAALAGSWTSLAFGFGGMRTMDGLSFEPIAMPDLGSYSFRVRYRNRTIEVAVGARTAAYRLVAGEALDFKHHGDLVRLEPSRRIERELPV